MNGSKIPAVWACLFALALSSGLAESAPTLTGTPPSATEVASVSEAIVLNDHFYLTDTTFTFRSGEIDDVRQVLVVTVLRWYARADHQSGTVLLDLQPETARRILDRIRELAERRQPVLLYLGKYHEIQMVATQSNPHPEQYDLTPKVRYYLLSAEDWGHGAVWEILPDVTRPQ